jgi:hypothetical protein
MFGITFFSLNPLMSDGITGFKVLKNRHFIQRVQLVFRTDDTFFFF